MRSCGSQGVNGAACSTSEVMVGGFLEYCRLHRDNPMPDHRVGSTYSSSRQEGLVYQPTAAFSLATLMNDWWLSSHPVTGSRSGRNVSTKSVEASRTVVSSAFRK